MGKTYYTYLIIAMICIACGCTRQYVQEKETHLTSDVYIDREAIFINTPKINEDEAIIDVDFDVINMASDKKKITAIVEINKEDKSIDKLTQKVELQDTTALSFTFSIPCPDLWTPEVPDTYIAKIILKSGFRILDEQEHSFELRTNDFISKKDIILLEKEALTNTRSYTQLAIRQNDERHK